MTLVTAPLLLLSVPVSVDDAELSRLAQQAAPASAESLAGHLTTLAWHLRQRDTPRALGLADEAERLLQPAQHALRARLQLVRAEARWLVADLPGCHALALAAEAGFAAAADFCGQSDAALARTFALIDGGQLADACAGAQRAVDLARAGGDRVRTQLAQAVLAFWSMVSDLEGAERQWGPMMATFAQSSEPLVAQWAHDFAGVVHMRQGRTAPAIARLSQAYALAVPLGQVRRAILASINVGSAYGDLNAHDAALEWSELSLGLARRAAWPASMGSALTQLGDCLNAMGQLGAARKALDEAVAVLHALPNSILLMNARRMLADLLLEQGEPQAAAEFAALALATAQRDGLPDLEAVCQRTLAIAWFRQGHRETAATLAGNALQKVLTLAGSSGRVELLLALAEILAPPAEPGQGARASLPYLLEALACGEVTEGFIALPATLQAAADEYAHLGQHTLAYAMATKANAARDHAQIQAAGNRALAMEARHEVARARAEAHALRERAQAQAQRAAALQEANDTLERLGVLGQDVTAQLDIDQVFDGLCKHLQGLLEAQHLSMWLLDKSGVELHLRLGLEQGRRLAPFRVALDDPRSLAARCVRQAEEVLHAAPSDAMAVRHIPGTLPTETCLFVPMQVRGRVIGALSVQSARPDAYGARERLVFRSACAWAAIALDNAAAVEDLETVHQQLRRATEAERCARELAEQATQLKGEFLANISHDLRTPLASLQGYLETLLLDSGAVGAAGRGRYLDAARAQSTKVNRLADELVALARLESGAMLPSPTRFSVSHLLVDVVRKLEFAVVARQQQVQVCRTGDVPDAMADAGMIERVLTNLLDNAITHTPPGSAIRIELCVAASGRLRVTVLDTGPGIPVQLRSGLFLGPSPVARTHRPGGGGLGLLIVQRLLQQHGCEISFVQRAGYGAVFEFDLPAAAGPSPADAMTGPPRTRG
jgi:signal transduction histidine kinase/tetratricopeptide (TPR) repeat protein